MIGQDRLQKDVKHRAFYATMSQLAAAGRHMRRRRDKRIKRKSLLRLLMPNEAQTEGGSPDPVKVAVLAINRVAQASMRASFTGTAIEVSTPDEATAAVFRAALAETGRNRATDRLIRIIVDSAT